MTRLRVNKGGRFSLMMRRGRRIYQVISIAVFEDMCIKNYAARQASDVALWELGKWISERGGG